MQHTTNLGLPSLVSVLFSSTESVRLDEGFRVTLERLDARQSTGPVRRPSLPVLFHGGGNMADAPSFLPCGEMRALELVGGCSLGGEQQLEKRFEWTVTSHPAFRRQSRQSSQAISTPCPVYDGARAQVFPEVVESDESTRHTNNRSRHPANCGGTSSSQPSP